MSSLNTASVQMADDEPIRLIFRNNLRVSGELLQGEVHLNFPVLTRSKIEEVHVKLRGLSLLGQTQQVRRQRTELARETISLWQQGKAYPPAGSHILVLPFQFILPPRALPSCSHEALWKKGNILYFVEVVGQRSGLHLDKRSAIAFPVIPPYPAGAELRSALTVGWQGQWRSLVADANIRRGLWGEYSHVKMTLVMPDIPKIPIMTKIPFTLDVVTTTKPMKLDETTPGEIFPAPPTRPETVTFYLERDVGLAASTWTASDNGNFVCYLGGFSAGSAFTSTKDVVVQVIDKVWVPAYGDEKKQKGSWKQEVTFKSHIYLNCPPTFESLWMVFNYRIRLKVDFPGIGNSLKAQWPVIICSSLPTPGSEAAAAWDGPPPEVDLPPNYYEALNRQSDDKDID